MHLSGGKGINVSIVLNNLGIRSTCLGFLAGYVGREIERELRQRGCHTDFIELESGCTRINVKVKEVCGRESELNGNGPEIDERGLKRLEEKVSALQDQDTLILSGNVPQGVAADVYGRLAAAAQGKRVTLVVDAEKSLLFPALPYRPFLIKPNHKELAEMFEVELSSREDLLVYAKELQAMGARNVLVSMAEQGALLLTETQEVYHAPACRGKVVNSVGAGDSMVAGFLYGYLREQSYAAALRYGTACGSASAFSKGIADRKTVEELLVQLKEREAC